MSDRIRLIDCNHPNEPSEVENEEWNQTRFEMRRGSARAPFEAELGGREFVVDPSRSHVGDLRECRIESHVQRLRTDRLTRVTEMIASLAHELDQPLTAATNYVKAARRLDQIPPERRPCSREEALDEAAGQLLRAGRALAHLLNFVSRAHTDAVSDPADLKERALRLDDNRN